MALRCLWCKSFHGRPRNLLVERLSFGPNRIGFIYKSTAAVDIPDNEKTRTSPVAQNKTESRSYDDGHPQIDLSFTNPQEAYRSKTTGELFRAYFVFQLCSIPWIVGNNKMVGNLNFNYFATITKQDFSLNFI